MGKQVEIVSVREDHTVQLNREELERILLDPKVKDKPVAVVSIMGDFRKGKSFLLNFLLRYLRSHDKLNWMDDEDTPLEGFSWSLGSEPNTKGINVWDEVFLVPTYAGDELAVLLMDTQGSFDNKSSATETATICSLSILASSVQIYNILQQLQENHLQHLQLAAEYGKLAQESTEGRPFQKLVFLIRDWPYPSEKEYGATGGRALREQFMATSAGQHQDNKDLRQSLHSSFSSIDCFLMPEPGKEIKEKLFDGRLSKLDGEFKQKLRELVPWLVSAEKLEVKKIAGKKITCKQLMSYFTGYVDAFKDGKVPPVSTLLQWTAEESNRNAKEEAKTFYEEQMGKATYNNIEELEKMHEILLEKAKDNFRAARKMGGRDVERRYLDILEKEITGIFDSLSYKQKLSDLKKAEEKMKEKFEKLINDLQEKAKALNQETEKLRRQAEYLRFRADMSFLISTVSSVLTPFLAALTVACPPVGLQMAAGTSQLLYLVSRELDRISGMAFADDFPEARRLTPEMFFANLASATPGLRPEMITSLLALPQGTGTFSSSMGNSRRPRR